MSAAPVVAPKTEPAEEEIPTSRFGGRISMAIVGATVAAVVVVLALTVAGSSGPAAKSQPTSSLQRAVLATLTSGGVRLSMSVVDSLGNLPFNVVGNGSCNADREECALSVVENQVVHGGSAHYAFDEILTPTQIYVTLPASVRHDVRRTWLAVPVGVANLVHAAGTYGAEDPLQGIVALAGQGAKVKRLGATTVDHAPAVQYLVQFPPSRFLRELPGIASQLPSWVEPRVVGVSYALTFEHVDVGSGGRILFLSFAHQSPAGQHGSFVVGETFESYGGAVGVKAPPQKDVVTLAELARLKRGGKHPKR